MKYITSCPLFYFLSSVVFASFSLQRQLVHHIRAAMIAFYLSMMVEKKRSIKLHVHSITIHNVSIVLAIYMSHTF
jgi:hypothetical protein